MGALPLSQWRRKNGLTQVEAARLLGVSQPYLSLLEKGDRPMTEELLRRVETLGQSPKPDLDDELYESLVALGYPGFAPSPAAVGHPDPTAVLAKALLQRDVDPRVAEGLPWVAWRWARQVNWPALVRRTKLDDRQNRLGFVADLALGLPGDPPAELVKAREELERARLVAEGTYFWDSMPAPVRVSLRDRRTQQAAHWNLLSTLKPEDLVHAQ